MISKIKDGLGSHATEQVENRKVGQKTMTRLIDLPVGSPTPFPSPEREGRIEISWFLPLLGEAGGGYQLQHFLENRHVVVEEKFPVATLEKRTEVVGVIVEKGTFAVGRANGIPMLRAPFPVVAEADFACQQRFAPRRLLHRNREFLHTIGRRDEAVVARGLLHIVLGVVDSPVFSSEQTAVPRNRTEISNRKKHII